MRKTKTISLSAIALGLVLAGCQAEMINDSSVENAYLTGFIKKVGLIAEDHNYSMAKLGELTVKTSQPADIQVVATVGGKMYSFYEGRGVTNGTKIRYDIPVDVVNVCVLANGQAYDVAPNGTVNLDKPNGYVLSREGETTNIDFYATNINTAEGKVEELTNRPESDRQPGEIGVQTNVMGGELRTNFETQTTTPSSLFIRKAAGSQHNKNQDYLENYYASSAFENVSIIGQHKNPNFYLYYLRKPEGVNYKIGMIIGNNATLKSSTKAYKIPMFYTRTMDEYTFRKRVIETNDQTIQGGLITFDLKNNKITAAGTQSQFARDETWEFNEAFKQQIRDMADVFACGNSNLRNYTYVGDNSITFNGVTVNRRNEYESDNAFLTDYSRYLEAFVEWYKEEGYPQNASKVSRLNDIKQYLTIKGYQFVPHEKDGNIVTEYPWVEKVEGTEDTYTLSFFEAHGANGIVNLGDDKVHFNGSRLDPAEGKDDNYHNLYEPEDNQFLLYYTINTYTFLPPALNGGHEFVYYVEFDSPVKGKTIITTADVVNGKTS